LEAGGSRKVLVVAAGAEGLGLHPAGPGAAQTPPHDGGSAAV
jgi:hypothetical protein